jgi:hypothetical protein
MIEQMAEPEENQPASAAEEGGLSDEDRAKLEAELEEQIRKLRVEDVILQGAVQILNLAARRIAKEDERDLEQAKVGIDAADALSGLVTEEARPQLRQAVSELKMLYAKHAGDGEGEPAEEPPKEERGDSEGGESKLWTPGQ